MIFVCPFDGWLIVASEWMPRETLCCEWCRRKFEQDFGRAWEQ